MLFFNKENNKIGLIALTSVTILQSYSILVNGLYDSLKLLIKEKIENIYGNILVPLARYDN